MSSKLPIGMTIILESRASAIEQVCERILSELQACDFSKEDVFAVHLGLEEAFLNAIKHGNEDDTTRKVTINYRIKPDEVEIFMKDQGKGFNPDSVPDPRCGDNIYKIGGRGLFLIRSYMDLIEFNKQGNCIRMVKYNSNKKSLASKSKQPIN
jgi:serine/threonine-protein kinase RsbW